MYKVIAEFRIYAFGILNISGGVAESFILWLQLLPPSIDQNNKTLLVAVSTAMTPNESIIFTKILYTSVDESPGNPDSEMVHVCPEVVE